ncbi:MAG: MmgE/PrpD family protein [Candidatus Rokubacteria bacterium]|nr:MmgE/PrpD family protein [Candidatus Rokubacteria bacterium]
MTATEALATFVHALDPDTLDAPVRDHTTLCVLDTLGIALAGVTEPCTRAARAVSRAADGTPEATIVVHGDRVPAPAAALVNGAAAFAHNFTDTTLSCIVHAGPVVVPAALAAGEAAGATGREVLAAVVAGYEVMTRVGNAINAGTARMAHHRKGFHPTATCGVFGATATAARLFRLTVDQTVQALGVAGSLASGLSLTLRDGSDVWRAHPGFAAHNGLLAARLAAEGLTGPVRVLDDARGFCAAFTDGVFDAAALTRDLGKRLLVLDAAFKLHNVAHVWALPLDALAALRAAHGFSHADVAEVVVTFPQAWTAIMSERSLDPGWIPETYSQATNDLRYGVAVGLRDGRVHVEQFDEAHLRDPAVHELARRVIPRPEPAFDAAWETSDRAPVDVEVVLTSGAHHALHVDYPRGAPQNPATREELEAKFDALASSALSASARARVIRLVRGLATVQRIDELTAALVVRGGDSGT